MHIVRHQLCGTSFQPALLSSWLHEIQFDHQMYVALFVIFPNIVQNIFFIDQPPIEEIIEEEKSARKSTPETEKEKSRDRDVSLSMAPLPIPLGPLGGFAGKNIVI